MLKKIITIRNIGRFRNHTASGDVELKCYTLVFAENGRGKTTLCAIFRSLQSGDPSFVNGRTMLGSTDSPEIRLLLDGGTAVFNNGAWNTTLPHIIIFDSTFISEHVYSGDTVGIEHRRGLYRVIVGRQGVELARRIDELDAASRAKATDIRVKAASVEHHVPQGVNLEEFLPLPEDSIIDEKIEASERERESVLQTDQIKTRAALSEATLPTVPSGLEALLARTIESIAEDAGQRVAAQIDAHNMHRRGEAWLSEGLDYVAPDDTCPFCSQSLAGAAALIEAYRDYFSENYNELHGEIVAMRDQVTSNLGDRQIAAVERTLDQNTAGTEFWTRYCEMTPPALPEASQPAETLRALRQAAVGLLDRKLAAPLEEIRPDEPFTTANAGLAELKREIVAYNEHVSLCNSIIAAKKAATESTDLGAVDAALLLLRATQKRHEPQVHTACQEYETAQAEKRSIEEEKSGVKTELDDYTAQVIGRYEQTINQLLEYFNAGFSITRTTHGYPGGVASSSYQILINNTPVDLGDSETPLDEPSFKNTLSAGDRSTLALAFFLAHLEHDPDRESKIVVFDDPFNSQDRFRKDRTVEKIRKCGENSSQVIVLSHDQAFLKRIWDRLNTRSGDRKCLEMARIGQRDTTICAWDIEAATQAAYRADHNVLRDFLLTGNGNPRDVVQKIRPVLESYCKYLGGDILLDSDTLGIIIGKIRDAGPTHQLYPIADDLDELNEYTCRYYHGENPNAATEPINDTELQGYVKSTLNITGGY